MVLTGPIIYSSCQLCLFPKAMCSFDNNEVALFVLDSISLWEAFFLSGALENSYIVEIAVTKQSCTARNHRPKAFPFPLLRYRNAAVKLGTVFAGGAVALMLGLYSRGHGDVA